MSTAITDSKFADLKAKLRELFELDKSDLDFGIYRIMAAKNKEVTEFLDRQLKDVVRDTLAAHGAGASDQVQTELNKVIAGLKAAEMTDAEIAANKKVADLRAKLASVGGASAAELEADIYNHLLAFFSRYYDEGDFISRRRYKGDVYAIPFGGEEVTLHWANKDQYYIKNSEWHKDYRFRVGGKTVRFRVVKATQEAHNNKEPDDAKRRYILDMEHPVSFTAEQLTLRFQFRLPSRAEKDAASEATVIFGGDFAKPKNPKKGDEREQFCADAERRAIAAAPPEWVTLLTRVSRDGEEKTTTAAMPDRTLLGSHLDRFTARNTFDYFIHKDLDGFLRRELDFYIKNEVVRLDDLESLPADHLAKVLGKVKAIRTVANTIIRFLSSVENFQKKMWLKKKLVLETNWLVTVDRVAPSLRDIVATNPKQWGEWEKLGFKPNKGDPMLISGPAWGTREYLDANDKLVVDTALFDEGFRSALLASDEVGVNSDCVSVLVNGDNFQAMALMAGVCSGAVNVLYLDPPYNTDAGPILYKNGLRSSSWITMLADRLQVSRPLLSKDAITCITIDDYQLHELANLLDGLYGKDRELGVALIRNNPSGRSTVRGFSVTHEYALFYGNSEQSAVRRLPRSKRQLERFTTENGVLVDWRNFRKDGGEVTHRGERPKQYFPVFVGRADLKIRVPQMTWNKSERFWVLDEQPTGDEVAVYPIDDKKQDRVWSLNSASTRKQLDDLRAEVQPDGSIQIFRRHYPSSGVLPRTWWAKKQYAAREHGTAELKRLFGGRAKFSFAKAPAAVADCLTVSGLEPSGRQHVIDYFAGSGTTGQAVLSLNRRDHGRHRFTLVEMGRYFHSVLKPRIAKVIYSPEWKDGKADVHGQGISALIKYFSLESYEDALNNLPAPSGQLLGHADEATKDALIAYSLDLELGPALLDLDLFRDPWGYRINAQLAGDTEIQVHRVDLVETFNYLLGMKVRAYGPLERYALEFERSEHADGLGRLKVKGRMKRDSEGLFVFQRVEGELLDGTRVLVVWRKLLGDAEKDAAALEAWMARWREETKERSEHRDYHQIYINGPVTLPQPTAEIRTVLPIEQTFKDRMFAETNGVQHG